MHRPSFLPKAGANLRLDCLTVPPTFITRPTNDPAHQHPDPKLPYRDEETIAVGKPPESLIIAFGILRKGKSRITYGSLPITGYRGKSLPVIISLDTYTMHADSATLERKSRVLKAEGNVSIADGSDSPPKLADCVILKLDHSNPKPQRCQPRVGDF